jgi:hypothetical protein
MDGTIAMCAGLQCCGFKNFDVNKVTTYVAKATQDLRCCAYAWALMQHMMLDVT